MRWIIFLLVVSFATMGAMDFEELLEQHKKEVLSTFIPQESKLKAFANFLKNSDLKKEKNRKLLQELDNELQPSADWYDTHQLEGKQLYNVYAQIQVIIKPFLGEQKNE